MLILTVHSEAFSLILVMSVREAMYHLLLWKHQCDGILVSSIINHFCHRRRAFKHDSGDILSIPVIKQQDYQENTHCLLSFLNIKRLLINL